MENKDTDGNIEYIPAVDEREVLVPVEAAEDYHIREDVDVITTEPNETAEVAYDRRHFSHIHPQLMRSPKWRRRSVRTRAMYLPGGPLFAIARSLADLMASAPGAAANGVQRNAALTALLLLPSSVLLMFGHYVSVTSPRSTVSVVLRRAADIVQYIIIAVIVFMLLTGAYLVVTGIVMGVSNMRATVTDAFATYLTTPAWVVHTKT